VFLFCICASIGISFSFTNFIIIIIIVILFYRASVNIRGNGRIWIINMDNCKYYKKIV
jgi:hypothetical protein